MALKILSIKCCKMLHASIHQLCRGHRACGHQEYQHCYFSRVCKLILQFLFSAMDIMR